MVSIQGIDKALVRSFGYHAIGFLRKLFGDEKLAKCLPLGARRRVGRKPAPGASTQGPALTPSGQLSSMPPRFWPSSASGSEKKGDLRELNARARHKLRIGAKNLRYTIEFFVGVFPGHKNAKRRQAALTSLKTLQDTLGSLNDIAARKALVSNGDGLSAHAAAMVDAGEAKADKLLERARAAHARFREVKAFWKS